MTRDVWGDVSHPVIYSCFNNVAIIDIWAVGVNFFSGQKVSCNVDTGNDDIHSVDSVENNDDNVDFIFQLLVIITSVITFVVTYVVISSVVTSVITRIIITHVITGC